MSGMTDDEVRALFEPDDAPAGTTDLQRWAQLLTDCGVPFSRHESSQRWRSPMPDDGPALLVGDDGSHQEIGGGAYYDGGGVAGQAGIFFQIEFAPDDSFRRIWIGE